MNAITPAKLMPPDHSTAASGMFPTEQTKLSTAISGPMSAPQTVCTSGGAPVRNRLLKTLVPSCATKPASTKPRRDLLVEHLPVAAEVVRDVRPGVDRRQALTPAQRRAGHVVLVPAVGRERVRARLLLQPRRDEQPQHQRHQDDHHEAAEVLGERELPAEQHPQHQAELPDEVRRGELEGQCRRRRRHPSGRGSWRSPPRRTSRRTRRRRAPSPMRSAAGPRRSWPPRRARAGPRPGRSRRSRSPARAPTRPPTPSARRRADRSR